MDAEAGNRRTAGTRWARAVFGIHFISHSHDAHAGTRARCYTPRNRGAVEFGEHRLVAPKTLGLIGIRLRPQAPFLHESCDTAMNALRNPGNFLIRRRGYTQENRFALAVNHVNSIQCDYVWFRTMSSTFISA
jgi:hypothetical protein